MTYGTSLPCPPGKVRVTLLRGSIRDAYRTFFSHWPQKEGPVWGHFSLTVGFNTIIAFFIAMMISSFGGGAFVPTFMDVLPFAQWIGFSVMGLLALGDWVFSPERLNTFQAPLRIAYYCAASLGGVYIGTALGLMLRFGSISGRWLSPTDSNLVGSVGISLLMCTIMYQIVSAKTTAAKAIAAANEERSRTLAAEKRATEAMLKMLQAQIEPHFLFNTLANVAGLIDADPQTARRMLEHFIHYLRASLSVTRQEVTTIAGEMEQVESYLSIFQVRMGARLKFSIDLPAALRHQPIAPMLVQPIVENAIEHGLEPTLEGGEVRIRVFAEGSVMLIEICDSGLGFQGDTSGGVGLANVCERLQLLYGKRGHLEISAHAGGGTRVVIEVPIQP